MSEYESWEIGDREVIVFVGKSGTGKTTLENLLLKVKLEDAPAYLKVVSFTTRPPRLGEDEGRDYFFITDDEFDRFLADRLIVPPIREVEGPDGGTHRFGLPARIAPLPPSIRGLVAVMDPAGVEALRKVVPEEQLRIFYIDAPYHIRLNRVLKRGGSAEEFAIRDSADRESFDNFREAYH